MYGWRARIGLLIAHSNTTMEPEFNRVAPTGVSIHASRVLRGERTLEALSQEHNVEQAVTLLSDMNVRAYAYACTAVNMAAGDAGDIAQARRIVDLTGKPAIPASLALVEALAALDIKSIAVATGLRQDVNEVVAGYWRDCGFEVLRVGGVDFGSTRKSAAPLSATPISSHGLQTPESVYNLARSVYEPRAQAVVVIGANLRSLEIAAAFEHDFGIPLISSSLATMWASLQAAGVREPIGGYGQLLEQQPTLGWVRTPRP